ncbi:MAG TPA: metal-sulfur cluster assembly factor [bacterium]
MAVSEQQVMDSLKPVEDPELHLGIVDLGLIYRVDVTPAGEREGDEVKVTMTFTSPFCPYGPHLKTAVERTVALVPGVSKSTVSIVFSPPWDPRTMATEDCKVALGLGGWDEGDDGEDQDDAFGAPGAGASPSP